MWNRIKLALKYGSQLLKLAIVLLPLLDSLLKLLEDAEWTNAETDKRIVEIRKAMADMRVILRKLGY